MKNKNRIYKQQYNIPKTSKEFPNIIFVDKEKFDNNRKQDNIKKDKLKKIALNSLLL